VSDVIKISSKGWFLEAWDAFCNISSGESYDWSNWPCPREEAVWRTLLGQRWTTKPRDKCYDSECHVELKEGISGLLEQDHRPLLLPWQTWHTCRKLINKAFLAWSPLHCHTIDFDEQERVSLSDHFEQLLGSTRAVGSRFAITKKGYIGTTPPMTAIGDAIFLHPECSTPIALRRLPSHQRYPLRSRTEDKNIATYQLVGSCYVLGLMVGERNLGMPHRGWKRLPPLVDEILLLV